MRGRVTIRRNLINGTPLGRRWFIDYKGNKPKALERHQDEEGEVFYTPAKWGKGRGQPSPQSRDAKKSFLISNLLLDLDQYEIAGVRPYDSKDQDLWNEHFQTSGRRGEVDEDMRELTKMLGQSRASAEKLVLHPTHPQRITDGDIISAALGTTARAKPVYTPRKDSPTSASQEHQAEGDGAEETYHIQELDHVNQARDRNALPSLLHVSRSPKASRSGFTTDLQTILAFGDGAQGDTVKEVRRANGIPDLATKNDEQLIRWMLLRQHNSAFVARRVPVPDSKDIITELEKVLEKGNVQPARPVDIASIRRITFHALNARSSLSSGESGAETQVTFATQIRKSVTMVLEANRGMKHAFFDTLTFANNLASRPQVQGNPDFALTVLSLRLQATAGLGYTKPMATYLDHVIDSGALSSDGDILKDVNSTIHSLDRNVMHMNDIGKVDNEELLTIFRILTGFEQTGPSRGDSLRSLILRKRSNEEGDTYYLSVFARYIALVGRVGGLRLLWSEWHMVQELLDGFKGTKKEQKAIRLLLQRKFQSALEHAQPHSGSSNGASDGKFETCAMLDCNNITRRSQTTKPLSVNWGHDKVRHQNNLDFDKMMGLPYDKWLDKVQMMSVSSPE